MSIILEEVRAITRFSLRASSDSAKTRQATHVPMVFDYVHTQRSPVTEALQTLREVSAGTAARTQLLFGGWFGLRVNVRARA